ncbi:hypothetical protein [Ignavibacterium sp.]|uniref:hypothetical protein n=1 Tax=Ignavibacterium sp. TaxID=2651167 RepID=UPI0021F94F0F|nr:hypothetical protein [Ignavibacterium sp.]BDQ04039.1 MAG: hypothetical protein KatS3mg037_2614 [Ignavibacterium sp.]
MGQQQLLLIVLGVIIVGIAIVVGINLFNANAEESAKDTMVSEGTNLGALAQQYYKKPTAMGGGGNTFTGWTIPSKLVNTPTGSWNAVVSTDNVVLTGTPNDYTWTVTTTVRDTSIVSVVND